MPPNLKTIFNRLNRTYFNNSIKATIDWKDFSSKTGEQGDRWGEYFPDSRRIFISNLFNPDNLKNISKQFHPPTYVLEYIIFHEMTHQLLPPKRNKAGRWIAHHAEFKAFEKTCPYYQESIDWFNGVFGACWQYRCIAYGMRGYYTALKKIGCSYNKKYYSIDELRVWPDGHPWQLLLDKFDGQISDKLLKTIEIIGVYPSKNVVLFVDSITQTLWNFNPKELPNNVNKQAVEKTTVS